MPKTSPTQTTAERQYQYLQILAPIHWNDRLPALTPYDLEHIDTHGRLEIQRIARIVAYFGARRQGADHVAAVKAQNRLIRQIRKALGYTYPDDPLTF